jgi:hypothetical protein
MFTFARKPSSSGAHSTAPKPTSQHAAKAPPVNPVWIRLAMSTNAGAAASPEMTGERRRYFGRASSEADVEAESSPAVSPGPRFERKPAISSPGDPHEREADEMANKVMRMADPAVQLQCVASQKKEEILVPIQRAAAATEVAHGRGTAVRASQQGGNPLVEATRGFFESRFGHDFSHVRIHADGQAADAARALNARAYTLGPNIVFGSGQYTPATDEGKRLLAHELTHVVQQSGAAHAKLGLSPVTSPIIQRELVATGDTAGFASLVNSIITTQLQLNVDPTGRVSLVGTNVSGPPTQEAQALTDALRRFISDSNRTTIRFIHGTSSADPIDQQVMIGSYAAARIDLDDLGQLGSGEGISAGSALAHELVEQYRRQVFNEDYPTAHAAGMAEEQAMTGARRGASTRREIDATSYEIEVAYHYPDRTVFVTRVVRNQNIVAVRRRTTRP